MHYSFPAFLAVLMLTFVFSVAVNSQDEYQFGHVKIKNTNVFHRTPLTYAFVNVKPVLAGRILLWYCLCVTCAKTFGYLTQLYFFIRALVMEKG